MKPTRREALETMGEALVTIAAIAAPSSAEAQAAFLTTAELASLAAIVDTIIPRTDTPGASDAGVPATIDHRLATSPQLAGLFRSGMKSLDADAQSRHAAAFSGLTAKQQVELLTLRADDPFFHMIKDMTVDAYYTSKEGLAEELGWHGNSFLTEFKGCTHPEHQI